MRPSQRVESTVLFYRVDSTCILRHHMLSILALRPLSFTGYLCFLFLLVPFMTGQGLLIVNIVAQRATARGLAADSSLLLGLICDRPVLSTRRLKTPMPPWLDPRPRGLATQSIRRRAYSVIRSAVAGVQKIS